IIMKLQPINEHLKNRSDRSAVHHLFDTLSRTRYLKAFATTALLSTGGFMLMPFSSAFSVNNLGITLERLPFVYMVTGACNIFAGPLICRFSDKFGSMKVFAAGTLLSSVMVLIYTPLGITPIAWV